jgi:hypothetical protein
MRETGQLQCDCEADWWGTYQLTGTPDQDPCILVAGLCAGGSATEVEFAGEPECTPSYQEAGAEWCSMEQQCTQSAEISEGISILSTEWHGTWCELDDQSWSCNCEAESRSLSFDYPESVAASEVCPNAVELCSAGTAELEGPLECTVRYRSASLESCDAQHDCVGAALIAGTQVQLHEPMFTRCYAEAEGQFSCECTLGSKSLTLEVSAPDAWTTCEEVGASCLDGLDAEAGE